MLNAAEAWGRGLAEASQDSLASAAPTEPEMQRERLNPQAANAQVSNHISDWDLRGIWGHDNCVSLDALQK